MSDLSAQTTLAEHHVRNGRLVVAKQRRFIAAIRARGGDCASAEDLLSLFERTLAIFEDDLDALLRRGRK